MEFLRTFYKVFPEYETVDVRCLPVPRSTLMVACRPTWAARAMLGNIYRTLVPTTPIDFLHNDTDT